jgi:tripartite-type tricarboxylate transporter receptor subunit TctC
MARIAKSPDLRAMYAKDGTVAVGSTPAEFRTFIASQLNHMKRVAQEFNIKAVD